MDWLKLLRLTPQPTEQMEPDHYRPVERIARALNDSGGDVDRINNYLGALVWDEDEREFVLKPWGDE